MREKKGYDSAIVGSFRMDGKRQVAGIATALP
jgi:hypothetical protein